MVMKASINMIKSPRDEDLPTKQEASATSSGLWSGLKNPRIVRVSRAFGGKDRHSKVSTIRGLRDRRVRLSVQTAIQLYDLQDRLGLNQPSKVVDWLLNAAREEIDKLPPLQIPSGQIPQSLPQSLPIENFKYTNDNEGMTTFPQSTYWQRSELEEDEQAQKVNIVNKAPPYSPYYHWEASNAYLSQSGNRSYQHEGPHVPESQIVLYPPGVMPSMFPSYVQMQMALQTPQLNDSGDPLHLGGPSVRHFQ